MDKFRANNHSVPKSYLNNWVNSNNKLWRYTLLVPHTDYPLWKPSSPRGICKHRHLYTRTINGIESDDVERWFDTEFESPASSPIEKVINNDRLLPSDWSILIRFLAAQDVRTPARMLEILERGKTALPEALDDITENFEEDFLKFKSERDQGMTKNKRHNSILPISVKTNFETGADSGTVKIETFIGRPYWLQCIKHLLEVTISNLQKHKWTILNSPQGIEWPTSDDPVIKLNYHNSNDYNLGGGWGSPGTEVFMPLSPKHLLYSHIGRKRLERGTILPIETARGFQKIIIEHAHREVYSKSQNPIVPELRPRKVNQAMYRDEKEHWENWHIANINAEQSL